MNQDSSCGNNVTYSPASQCKGASTFESALATTNVSSTEQLPQVEILSFDLACSNGHISHFEIHKDDVKLQLVEADERQMGTESHFEAGIALDCNECGTPINVTLHLWEYPDGVFNASEIEVEGGKLTNAVDDDTMKLFIEKCGH